MRSLTCSLGWVQRAFTLLLLIVTATSAGLPGFTSSRSGLRDLDREANRNLNGTLKG